MNKLETLIAASEAHKRSKESGVVYVECEKCEGCGVIPASSYGGPRYAWPEYDCHECYGFGEVERD